MSHRIHGMESSRPKKEEKVEEKKKTFKAIEEVDTAQEINPDEKKKPTLKSEPQESKSPSPYHHAFRKELNKNEPSLNQKEKPETKKLLTTLMSELKEKKSSYIEKFVTSLEMLFDQIPDDLLSEENLELLFSSLEEMPDILKEMPLSLANTLEARMHKLFEKAENLPKMLKDSIKKRSLMDRAVRLQKEKKIVKEKEIKEHEKKEQIVQSQMTASHQIDTHLKAEATIESYMKPEILTALIEKLSNSFTFMQEKGLSSTTILLNSNEFSSSPFYDTEIVIEQYASAPGSLNIRFMTSSEAAQTLFEANLSELEKKLEKNQIKVGKVEIAYKPIFRRKSSIHEEQKETQ